MEEPSSSRKSQRLNQDQDDAFHQVAQPSAYAYAPSSSTQPKLPYDVFINHRGTDVKDTLAQYIHDKLSKRGVKVFLDKEALLHGDSIPKEIKEAMNDACLHVAIFSERYAESAWCLAELSYMLKTGRKIIPIFYDVKPYDLRFAEEKKGAYAVSFAQHRENGYYTEEKLTEWEKALQAVSSSKGYEVKNKDWKHVLEGLPKSAVRAMNEARVAGHTNASGLEEERAIVPRPSQGKYPDAVGIDKAKDHVIGLLDLQDQSTRKIVVVYGVGGIGKTTLATAVFNTLNLTGYKHCRVVMEQDCSKSDIKSMQEQILRDLFNKDVRLRDHVEGCEQLSEAFRKGPTRPLFMFIDNALKGSDLAMLLPKGDDLSYLPVRSRMLITTRKLDETDIVLHPHHIQRCPYPVEFLPSSEAKRLLCKKVLGSVDARFSTDINIDGLVKCCGGIPLVLELVGSKLLSERSRLSHSVSHWVDCLKKTLQEGEGDLSERVVDCVYNSLQDSYKEAFLDVASFFHYGVRDFLAKIVGNVEIKGLEDAALVKTSGNVVTMHDIVRARGKWLSKWNRITDLESLKAVLRDQQKLQQLKGIKIPYTEKYEGIEIQSDRLDLTSQTLRILLVNNPFAKFKGQCKRRFESLRFLQLTELQSHPFLSIIPKSLRILVLEQLCDPLNTLSPQRDWTAWATSLRWKN